MSLSEFFGVSAFGDFGVVAASGTFDVGAIGALDNLNIAPVGDHGIEFGLVERFGLPESNGIWVVFFEWNIVFTSYEIGAERTAGGDQFNAVFGGAEWARESGKSQLLDGLLEGDGFDGSAFWQWCEAGLLTGIFFAFAKLDEAAVFADFGVDSLVGFGVFAE